MPLNSFPSGLEQTCRDIYSLAARLYPIHRCITGDGVRQTLQLLNDYIPVGIHEVPTGTQVFDWEVPNEWNIRDAYVADETGRRLIDYQQSNLHVVNYSLPVDATMTWRELRPHLHTLPEHPGWIPYRTAYFREQWGFCLTQHQFDELEREPDRHYHVRIDATLDKGSLTYGELLVPGQSSEEVLISTHACHPSLANDNASGIAVATHVAQHLLSCKNLRYSYRFIFVPATIGAITWLSVNHWRLDRIKHGLVLSLLGDTGNLTYKQSWFGDAEIDRIVVQVLGDLGCDFETRPFEPFGYDERQFGSPGIRLKMGCLMRTPNGEFPEYHSSADNLDLICPESLGDSWAKCVTIVEALEANRRYLNLSPNGEPQLGRRGLYSAFGERNDRPGLQRAVLWLLNLSDGDHSVLDVARRSGLPFLLVAEAADLLVRHDLLATTGDPQPTLPLAKAQPKQHSDCSTTRTFPV